MATWLVTTLARASHSPWPIVVLFTLEMCAVLSVPSVLLRRRGTPAAALSWLLGLFAVPGFGVLAWWMFGRTRIERKRRKQAKKRRGIELRLGGVPIEASSELSRLLPERAFGVGAFASSHNSLTLFPEGRAAFDELEAAITDAKRSIRLFFYIWELDEVGLRLAERLVGRAAEGIDVRVLVDGFGSQSSVRHLKRTFEKTNVHFAVFSPFQLFPPNLPRLNFVNHRKLALFDQMVGFTGGMNIAREYRYDWRDLLIRIEGPAVGHLDQVFIEDWFFATNQILPEPEEVAPVEGGHDALVVASGPDSEPWIFDLYFVLLTSAKRRAWLCTPYFVPSPAIQTALRTAAGRGVDVRIVLPRKSDVPLVRLASRSFYRNLVQSGVRIFEYEETMLHAKGLLVDDEVVGIGSANIDNRSFSLSYELTTFLESKPLAEDLGRYFESLVQGSREIDELALKSQTTLEKLKESAAHLLSPLL